MQTIVRDSSRQTRRLFSRPRHASGPLLRPFSRQSLQRSQLRKSLTTVRPIFAHPKTSRGRRSFQYRIEYIFPRPSQAYALWYRLSRRTVSSMLVERHSHLHTQVAKRHLDDTARRCRTWLNRRTYRRLHPALQRNRFKRLLSQFPELYLWPHQETFCAMMFSRVGISDQTLKPFAESRTISTDSLTQTRMLPLTNSTPDLVCRQLPPVSLLDGLIPTH
nr:MAG TPA: hypothetical protein [Caudoviricetes sp.]